MLPHGIHLDPIDGDAPVAHPDRRPGEDRGLGLGAAIGAARRACRRLPSTLPEVVAWRAHEHRRIAALRSAHRLADPPGRHALETQLHAIAEGSLDDRDCLRRLTILTERGANLERVVHEPRLPLAVRRRARELSFAPYDRIARVRRDPMLEALARRRNEIFTALGLRPRSPSLLDWCDVAVRIAVGGPLQQALTRLPEPERSRTWAAKVRFDLLAIELNIALDDLADDGRDAGLFAATVHHVLGPGFARRTFCPSTAVGRFFLEARARTESRLRSGNDLAAARYVALVHTLYRETVRAGRALAGSRWNEEIWLAELQRVLGAMMLSIVENARPELLADLDGDTTAFHGPDRARVQAANANRVIFERVGLWCAQAIADRLGLPPPATEASALRRLLVAFERLQLAQQHANCLATLDRELAEGDRSNCVLHRAETAWRDASPTERRRWLGSLEADLRRQGVGAPVDCDDLVGAIFAQLRAAPSARSRAALTRCLHALIDRTDALRMVIDDWQQHVQAATAELDALGLDGAASQQRQTDLLLLHLLLLRDDPRAGTGARR